MAMTEKFAKAIQILKNLNQPDRVINRDRVHFNKLMDKLGNPYRSFRPIHITGTNGKGSVSVKAAETLNRAGYKTGLYTSPHLFSFRERIKIGNEMISRQQISEDILKIQEISKKGEIPLSYFQYLTAVAFLHFQRQRCQYVALQVGLGGKNDTTNIVDPEVSIITSIGLDHMDLLGPTLEDIARQKAGIIRKNKPVVLGPKSVGYQSIDQAIKDNNCRVFQVIEGSYDQQDFDSENKATTLKAIEALQSVNRDLNLSQSHIEEGIKSEQPCRMELLKEEWLPPWGKGKKIYFDVGHNPQALKKVSQYLMKNKFDKNEISFVFGTSKGKKFAQSLKQIEKVCAHIYLVEANHFRACKIEQLQAYVGESQNPNKYRSIANGSIKKTLEFVTVDPYCKVIVVSGSFFIMPEARGHFQPDLIKNPEENINEIYQLHQKINKRD